MSSRGAAADGDGPGLNHDVRGVSLNAADGRTLAEHGARRHRAFDQKRIEAALLREIRQGLAGVAHKSAGLTQAESHAEGDALDHWRKIEGQQSGRADVDAPTAGFVAGKGRSIEQKHTETAGSALAGGGAARGTGAGDDHVIPHQGRGFLVPVGTPSGVVRESGTHEHPAAVGTSDAL